MNIHKVSSDSVSRIIVLTCAVVALITYNFMSGAWTPPVDTPPDSNVEPPIDISSSTQAKAGNFAANVIAATTEMRAARYCDPLGNNCFSDLPSCGNGQTLVSNNGEWSCGTMPSGTPPPPVDPLIGNIHTRTQCTDLGGTVVTSGSAVFCRFNQTSCPSGWLQYENWSQTSASSCRSCAGSCTTGAHAFNNIPRESCTYQNGWVSIGKGECNASGFGNCSAAITAVGCY